MAVHDFHPTRYFSTFGPHDPVLHIAAGDTVITTTVDARGLDAQEQCRAEGANPQTGPFYVEGAGPGDMLVVHLDHLYANRDSGWSSTLLASHVVDPWAVRELPERADGRWSIDRAAGTATLLEPASHRGSLALPLAPMLGCLGVAPDEGEAISSATSGPHGGNMDYRGFQAGAIAYFPVFLPGALFFLGDGHAVQGAGEIGGTGIETSFDVQFTVHLHKGKRIRWPRGEDAGYIFAIGNARPLDQAAQHATTEMYRWLQEDYGLDARAACILLGQCSDYDVGNFFDPAYTMVCKVAKRWLHEGGWVLARQETTGPQAVK
jgi:acetamidase/formamidase